MGDRLAGIRFVIRDRDSKFSGPFDEVFRSEGTRIIKTPVRAPRANAFAERWVRTVRMVCLDWMLVFGRRHLERVLRAYVIHYKGQAPSGPRPADARAGGGSASEADSPAKGPNAPSPGRAYP